MVEIIKVEHNTQAWLDIRKTGIGGSDAAAVLGISPYKTNVELWEEKTGRREQKNIENSVVQYGKNAEFHLVKLFELDYPDYTVIFEKDTVFKRDFMTASLDARLARSGEGLGVLEIKTTEIHTAMAAKKWDGKIPQHYYAQILHYMIVMNAMYAFLKVQMKETDERGFCELTTRHYKFQRADVLKDMKHLYLKEKEFWGYVERNERPPEKFKI